MIAANFMEYEQARAKERQHVGRPSKKELPANLPEDISPPGDARDIVGKKYGVGGRSVT